MLKDGLAARLFVRTAIFCLRAIAPFSLLYCCARFSNLVTPSARLTVQLGLDAYATSEALLYLAVYLPRKFILGLPAPPLDPLNRSARKKYCAMTWNATYDVKGYLQQWFYGASIQSIGREDVKDFLLWRFWNRTTRFPEDEDELEEYLIYVEEVLGHDFASGYTGVRSMMVTFEPLQMLHRPLIWYMIVGVVELKAWITLLYYGFQHHRLPILRIFTSFPFRLPALLSPCLSPTNHLSYWHLPHKNEDAIPVLFIHGIGIGLDTYTPFFQEVIATKLDVGIIALEILPICSRICRSPVPTSLEMAEAVSAIFMKHKWTKCVLVTHSYGSINAAHLMRHPLTRHLIDHCIFVDPVAFSFHAPAIAYNFLRRRPVTASEVELYYFACTDPDVVRALTRSFVWHENSLWREDIEDRRSKADDRQLKSTIIICGRDIITDTVTLGRYLTRQQRAGTKWYREAEPTVDNDSWKYRPWTGSLPVEVLWVPGINHAELFDDARDRRKLIEVLKAYVVDTGNGTAT